MSRSVRRGYPITAFSAVNALGTNTREVMEGLRRGEPVLSPPPEGTPLATVCGRVPRPLPALPDALAEYDSWNSRLVQQALAGIREELAAARERWGAGRVGIAVGSSTAAMDVAERAFGQRDAEGRLPAGFDLLRHGAPEGLQTVVRALSGAEGPAIVVSTACSSSGKTFGSARRWLDAGIVDAVLVGGADCLCQTTLRGFASLGLVSEEPARPFSAERRGINIGEAAGFALVERSGEGPRLLGVGESGDAHHMSAPDPEGRGARLAMEAALRDAGVRGADVDHVNAHGTGTLLNDAMEARAIREALGPRPSVVSTKGYVGHTLGAAGATEAAFVLDALLSGWTPASAGAAPADPDLPIDVALEARSQPLRLALSNSFAFGGSNVSVLFGAPE